MTGNAAKTIADVYDEVMSFHQETKTDYQTLHALALRNVTTNDRIERLLERLQDRMTKAEERISQLEIAQKSKRKAKK
jgi:predicted ribosome quality control (RQC) complex YloA/Tae2 family protein